MEDLTTDLKAFLLNQPFLQLIDNKRVKCTLNDHEFPCDLAELQRFINGKKYQKLSSVSEFNYSQYEPHIVHSSKQPMQLFCKLTLRHLNRQPHHVLKHVNGKRFKKALGKYEDCMREGIAFVPARLQNKRPKNHNKVEAEGPRRRGSKQKNEVWEPSSNDEEEIDSEDSMSDLYPPTMFLQDNPEAEIKVEKDGTGEKKEDDFQTDDDKEEENMEVESDHLQKRKKAQSGGVHKKFKNNNWKKKKSTVP
ncbi:unnamed protein product [Gadus morhua 'NCC']|uniref:surfeit locus protein 2 n=1 Tax=Gadus chalcogrammus TaxID=1042646 RepID=UPI0024C2FF53|nr:surfeit locus protein 2 [Gadus chalcogrammus]